MVQQWLNLFPWKPLCLIIWTAAVGKKLVCRTGVSTADVDFNGFRASFTISLASYGSRQILLYSGLLGSRQSIKNMSTVFFIKVHVYCQHNDNESPPG